MSEKLSVTLNIYNKSMNRYQYENYNSDCLESLGISLNKSFNKSTIITALMNVILQFIEHTFIRTFLALHIQNSQLVS